MNRTVYAVQGMNRTVSAVQGINSHPYTVTNSKTYAESLRCGHRQNTAKCKYCTGNLEHIIITCYSKIHNIQLITKVNIQGQTFSNQ
jgi:hypothetical protein